MDRELTISRNLCPGTILQSTKVLPKSFRKFHTSINFRVVTKLDIPPLRLTTEKSEGAADGTADGTKVPVSHYLKLVYF